MSTGVYMAFVFSLLVFLFGAWFVNNHLIQPMRVEDTINKAENRIANQEWFEATYQSVQNYKRQIVTAKKNVADQDARDPNTFEASRFRTVLQGLQNQCSSVVSNYNAQSNFITAEQWRSDRLPKTLIAAECE